MRAVLLALLGLLATSGQAAAAQGPEVGKQVYVSNRAEEIAQYVFVGDGREMPVDGTKRLAIRPTTTTTGYFIPTTFEQALAELQRMVPSWQRVAMALGEGDDECSVTVNGRSYDALLFSWVEVHWHLEADDSAAAKMFRQVDIDNEDMMAQALQSGFCEYLKHGEAAGVAAIRTYSGS